MKNRMKKVFAVCLVCACIVLASACKGSSDEPVPESNGFDAVSADEEQQAAITELLNRYFSALGNKDLTELYECADSDFELCRNETAFSDLTSELGSAKAEKIDFDTFQQRDGSYMVTVDYTLDYTGSFTDPEGSRNPPGEYSRKEIFSIRYENGSYKITGTEKTAAG